MAHNRIRERLSLVISLALVGTAMIACGNSGGKATGSGAAMAASSSSVDAGLVPYTGPDKILAIDAASRSVTVSL
jgi:hypothetical protein